MFHKGWVCVVHPVASAVGEEVVHKSRWSTMENTRCQVLAGVGGAWRRRIPLHQNQKCPQAGRQASVSWFDLSFLAQSFAALLKMIGRVVVADIGHHLVDVSPQR